MSQLILEMGYLTSSFEEYRQVQYTDKILRIKVVMRKLIPGYHLFVSFGTFFDIENRINQLELGDVLECSSDLEQ